MNWLLIITPVIGVVVVVMGVFSLRRFLPLRHVEDSEREGIDEAISKTAVTIATVVGAAIRDERGSSSRASGSTEVSRVFDELHAHR